jgi:mannose-1-phosphate guanylyltransferase
MINNLLIIEESLKLIIIRTIKLINIIKYKHKNDEDKIYIICNIEALNIIENKLDEVFSEEQCLKENINITIITEPLYRGNGSSICISALLDIENNLNDDAFSKERSSKENTINLSKRSYDKELFSKTIVEENTINLSKRSYDKELFSKTIVEENTHEIISFILPINLIFNENEFILCCIKGIEYINNNIVTIGIKDKSSLYYEYGYIKMKNNELKIDYIEDFIKNPEYMKTYEYYSLDEYLFNSGIYIFKNKNVLDCYKKYSNDIYECCNNVLEQSLYNKIICKDNYKIINLEMKHYYNCRITSFEYSIMEYLIRDIYKNINSLCISLNKFQV